MPSGAEHIVAYAEGSLLCLAGTRRERFLPAQDCTLVSPARPEERLNLLKAMSGLPGPDSRKVYAMNRLAEAERILPKEY